MNIPLLVAVAVTVYLSGRGIGNHGKPWPFGIREALLAAIAATSYFSTSRKIHQENRFSFGPLIEVAVVFVGLFITMTPALLLLDANAAQIGLNAPAHFFWASGLLSSVLDNAPTYLAFAATACGAYGFPAQGGSLGSLLRLDDGAQTGPIVAAISCGCVFMGALTYIGNGPNLLVKAVADDARISTPGFFRYLIYSSTVLVPLFVLVTILFFRV